MTTDIIETLPWIDYREVFAKIEERGRSEGITQGRKEGRKEGITQGITQGITEGMNKRDMEIALKAFDGLYSGSSLPSIINMLKGFNISDDIIESARIQAEAAHTCQAGKRPEPEQ